MKNSKLLATSLLLSGAVLLVFGLLVTFAPVFLYANDGAHLPNEPTLLSNVRASGGALLSIGVLILLGVFVERLRYAAAVLSPLAFTALGLARVVGVVADGTPATVVVGATIFNFVVAAAGIAVFARARAR